MSASTTIVKAVITGDERGLKSASKDAQKDLGNTGKAGSSASKTIKAGFAVGAASAAAFAVSSVKAFMDYQDQNDNLRNSLKNTHESWDDNASAIKHAEDAMQQFGLDKGQTDDLLAHLVTETGSVSGAMGALPHVLDLATKFQLDYNTAAKDYTQLGEGNTKSLRSLGLQIPPVAGGLKAIASAQAAVNTANANVASVEEKIHDGRLTGKTASDDLKSALDRQKTAEDKLTGAKNAGKAAQDEVNHADSGASVDASNTLTGKLKEQEAAWRNIKIEAGQGVVGALADFQKWSQKTGLPLLQQWDKDLNRYNADLIDVGHAFEAIGRYAKETGHSIGEAFTPEVDALKWLLGGGGSSSHSTPPSVGGPRLPGRASGGSVIAGRAYMVGERGPEPFIPDSNGTIIPNGAGRGGGNVYITMPAGANGADVARALKRHQRLNGSR